MGGEKLRGWGLELKSSGSPPRGRGKARVWCCPPLQVGITPAWAGKSCGRAAPRAQKGDHPRVGGEKIWLDSTPCVFPGSPPRGRGKVFPSFIHSWLSGITPAWAGKSCIALRRSVRCGDHPRVGGEKPFDNPKIDNCEGSPPRGRGKGPPVSGFYIWLGITPAWAGKRLKRSHRSGIFISGPIPFHSVLHRPAGSGGSRAGRDGSPAGQPQNAGPA